MVQTTHPTCPQSSSPENLSLDQLPPNPIPKGHTKHTRRSWAHVAVKTHHGKMGWNVLFWPILLQGGWSEVTARAVPRGHDAYPFWRRHVSLGVTLRRCSGSSHCRCPFLPTFGPLPERKPSSHFRGRKCMLKIRSFLVVIK